MSPVDTAPKIALCLPGGGAPGVMYQIGALAALEHSTPDFRANDVDIFVGSSSGASLAAGLAGGVDIERIYRSFLDPGDDFFPLERRHILHTDAKAWAKSLRRGWRAMSVGSKGLVGRVLNNLSASGAAEPWTELEGIYQSLPPGLFSLEAYEGLLNEVFTRRQIATRFEQLPAALRILVHDVETGEGFALGDSKAPDMPVPKACVASMATPPFFAPVRFGGASYFNPGPCQMSHVDVALELGATVIVVVNPLVPIRTGIVGSGAVGTGAARRGVYRKGALWVNNQAGRIKLAHLIEESCLRAEKEAKIHVVNVLPDASDEGLMLYNPMSYAQRRSILEQAYFSTRADVAERGRLGPWQLSEAESDASVQVDP